jgi:hypothetical protein
MSEYERKNTRFGDGYDIVQTEALGYGITDKKYVFEDIQDPVVADALCHLLKKVEMLEQRLANKDGKPSEQKSQSFIEDLGNGVEKHDLLLRYPSKKGNSSI